MFTRAVTQSRLLQMKAAIAEQKCLKSNEPNYFRCGVGICFTLMLLTTCLLALFFTGIYGKDAQHTVGSPAGSSGGSSVGSCDGRCNDPVDSSQNCQCNSACEKYGDCCSDYSTICKAFVILNSEIIQMSEQLYSLDSNRASPSDIILNKQTLIADSQTGNKMDEASDPLYTFVNEEALFVRPTFAKLIALQDNYERKTGVPEVEDDGELLEQREFLDVVFNSPVMDALFEFLHKKGKYSLMDDFKTDVEKMWFGFYSRSSGVLDSSGFEHVFVGEIKKSKVSGLHNWVRFYMLEKKRKLNYYSYSYDEQMKDYPDVLAMQFMWDGFYKQVGSGFIGSSPEFDLAISTLCFITRPNQQCAIQVNGKSMKMQTYTWTHSYYDNGKKYVASAYVNVP
uniref:uridylate-specific endoribonuclease isoform X2 n=1 Tax=Myxine glutinosa TaxID=7769 RepID=UPI00358EFCD7